MCVCVKMGGEWSGVEWASTVRSRKKRGNLRREKILQKVICFLFRSLLRDYSSSNFESS